MKGKEVLLPACLEWPPEIIWKAAKRQLGKDLSKRAIRRQLARLRAAVGSASLSESGA